MQFDAIWTGLNLVLGWQALLWLTVGVVLCQIVVAIPGLGGTFVLVMLLPLVITLDPISAIAVLIGVAAVSGTGNSITSILFGVPGSSMGVATVFDGYPMARKGLAGRALAAAFTASAVGGVIGAIVLIMIVPVSRPLVLALGPPEFFMIILATLIFVPLIQSGDAVKAMISGGLGLLIAFIGQEPNTAYLRYTFGHLYLWDGISFVPFLIGLFAVAEMLRLTLDRSSIAKVAASASFGSQLIQGVLDVFRHWRTTLQSSIVGVLVGLVPGLGGETSQFIAYSQAARTSKNRANFGKGAVEGVIAADAATNSKEGGSMVPTLLLGIPGSSGMAVLMLILIAIGVQPGRLLLQDNPEILWMMIWLLVLASILATLICLAVTKFIARATTLSPAFIVGPVLAVSFFGAYATNVAVGDLWVLIFSGLIGYVMIRFGYSRTTLVIGFVLGGLAENNFLLALGLFGWGFVTRPIAGGIGILLLVALAGSLIKAARNRVKAREGTEEADRDNVP